MNNLALQGDNVGALSTVSRTLHATPWTSAARSRIAHLLCQSPPFDPPADSTDPLAPYLPTLETTGRLTRASVPGVEDAHLRSRRSRMRGGVALGAAGEAETAEDERALDEQALRLFERSLWVAPWQELARSKFETARKPLASRIEDDEHE